MASSPNVFLNTFHRILLIRLCTLTVSIGMNIFFNECILFGCAYLFSDEQIEGCKCPCEIGGSVLSSFTAFQLSSRSNCERYREA